MTIRLIVPDNVEAGTVVYVVERCPKRISDGIAGTTAPLLELWIVAARIDELLAVARLVFGRLLVLVEQTDSRFGCRSAARKRRTVELEDEPPIDRHALLEQGRRRIGGTREPCHATKSKCK